MPKAQIPKEKILSTALSLLIKEGTAAITIRRLAKELNCSTQPISWTFGNMDNFREEFSVYVLDYFNRKIFSIHDPRLDFESTGVIYLKIAFEEPNLIYFVRDNSRRFVSHGGIGSVFDNEKIKEICFALHEKFNITESAAAWLIQNIVIYTQGLISMIVDKTLDITYDSALERLGDMYKTYLTYLIKNESEGD